MRVHRRPAATTVAAVGLIVVLTTAFAAFAVLRAAGRTVHGHGDLPVER